MQFPVNSGNFTKITLNKNIFNALAVGMHLNAGLFSWRINKQVK
jgi:hypothetical protein